MWESTVPTLPLKVGCLWESIPYSVHTRHWSKVSGPNLKG